MLAAGLGLAALGATTGYALLDPRNLLWLGRGNPASHYLGWHFFRDSPWTIPPGANPDFGLELSNSILYSDSIPLLALGFKLIEPILPDPFQYLGLWVAACFILQGVLAYALLGAFGLTAGSRLAGTVLFLFAPVFLFRLNEHVALAGQWILLAALYLYVARARFAAWRWLGLITIASLVHAYLMVMVLAVFAAEIVRRVWDRGLAVGSASAWFVSGAVVSVACLWAAGFFLIESGFGEPGFGYYKMNVLAPVDANGWSYLLPDIPGGPGEYEGFAYYGLGVLLLVVLTARSLASSGLSALADRRRAPLVVAFALLTALALTNRVSVASVNLVIPTPDAVENIGSLLRTSGRMAWPVVYGVMLAVVVLAARAFGRRLGTLLLGTAALIQVVDTQAGWSELPSRHFRWGTEMQTRLQSDFWRPAVERYACIRHLPVSRFPDNWMDVAYLAATTGRATDAAYLARLDTGRLHAARTAALEAVGTGRFEPDSLFVFDDAVARSVWPHVGPDDLFTEVDGLVVFGPGGRNLANASGDAERLDPMVLYAALHPTQIVEFAPGGKGRSLLGYGWGKPEAWGVPSDGPVARLHFRTAAPAGDYRLRLQLSGRASRDDQPVTVKIAVDGRVAGTVGLSAGAEWIELPLSLGQAPGRERPHTLLLSASSAGDRDMSTHGQRAAPHFGLVSLELRRAE